MSKNLRNLIEEQAEIHQVLSNPSRLSIVFALIEEEMSVGDIAEKIGASLQNTSQHLRLMKDKGVLEARRDGQTIFYQIAAGDMGQAYKRIINCLER